MRKLLTYINTKEKSMVVIGVLFVVVQVWLELKMPEYMSAITLLVKTPGSDINEILTNGGYSRRRLKSLFRDMHKNTVSILAATTCSSTFSPAAFRTKLLLRGRT